MAEAPDLRSSGVALTDPMAGVPIPQHSPLDLPARAGKPATTLPLQQSRPKSRRGLIAALLLIACASLAGLLFAANRKLPLKWPLQGGAPAPPPLISAPAPTGVEAPAHVEPLPVDPAPLPPAPARPPPAPAPRPAVPAPPMTPPSTTPPLTVPPMPPVLPGTPPAIPTVPPNAPPALPPTPTPAPNPPGLPTLPGIPLPWGNAAAGACDRCIAEVRNGGHYAIPLAAAQHLLCDDPAARERCAVDIREASPALAERAARDGDCAAAWATKAAALNLGVSADRFGNVDALCNR